MQGNSKKLAGLVARLKGTSRAIVSPSNRLGLWAIGLGAVLAVALLSVPYGFADGGDDGKIKCDLSTLKGMYLGAAAGSGMLFPPAFGVTTPMVTTAAGYSIYNGDGTGEDHITFTVDGIKVPVPPVQPFVYTLNPDCSGTKATNPSAPQPGPRFDIYVAPDGSALTGIITDPPGFSANSYDRRVKR